MNKKFVFIKNYTTPFGVIKEGSDVCEFHGFIYFNGAICDLGYASLFRDLLKNEELKKEYLREVIINKNEF